MAIGPFTTARSGGDSSWMGSRHAVAEAHPGTLDAAAFTGADGVEGGVVPSGYPIQEGEGGLYEPYDGSGQLAFSIDDRDISNGDEPTAVLWHGRIKVDNLPITFAYPTGTAFTFDGGTPAEDGGEG